jgi:DNA polymerase
MNPIIRDITECEKCSLCLNQRPLLDNLFKGRIFWVGLSAVKVSDVDEEVPLSANTNSGRLVNEIENQFVNTQFYKTNLVKCLPLTNGKIRYPNRIEMRSCYSNLNSELQVLKPQLVFLLGKQVATFVSKILGWSGIVEFDKDFHYSSFRIDGITFVPIHHPSYILVFKRKKLRSYITQVKNTIERNADVVLSIN